MTEANTMLLHTLTYLRDAATCPTFEGRTAEAAGGRNMSILPPPHTGRKWLRANDFGARAAEGHKARLRPATGRGRALWRVSLSHTRNEIFTLYIINNLNLTKK